MIMHFHDQYQILFVLINFTVDFVSVSLPDWTVNTAVTLQTRQQLSWKSMKIVRISDEP